MARQYVPLKKQIRKCCKRCLLDKPASDFYKYRYVCKACSVAKAVKFNRDNADKRKAITAAFYVRHAPRLKEYALKYKQENRERYLASARRTSKRRRLKSMGMTEAQLLVAFDAQSGHCAICRTEPVHLNGGRYVHIDHCHKTGMFRGILCVNCNTGLGKFGDDSETLMRASVYLRERANANTARS